MNQQGSLLSLVLQESWMGEHQPLLWHNQVEAYMMWWIGDIFHHFSPLLNHLSMAVLMDFAGGKPVGNKYWKS